MPETVPHITPIGAGELPIVTELAHRIWPPTFESILAPEQMAYMLDLMYSPASLRQQLDDGVRFFLLRAPEPVGYLALQHGYREGTSKVHKLYVLPERHGEGLGRRLIDYAVGEARAATAHTLRLDVNYQNPALGFYEHLGFRNTGRVDTEIGRGYLMEDYVMELTL